MSTRSPIRLNRLEGIIPIERKTGIMALVFSILSSLVLAGINKWSKDKKNTKKLLTAMLITSIILSVSLFFMKP